jgi:hypothetical protein
VAGRAVLLELELRAGQHAEAGTTLGSRESDALTTAGEQEVLTFCADHGPPCALQDLSNPGALLPN